MNNQVNEALAGKAKKASSDPELISAQARELLNLRRLPASLTVRRTAILLGLAEHDIPVLVSAGLLQPLGDPPANGVKHFAAIQILELAGDVARLSKICNTLYEYWRGKNASKGTAEYRPRQTRNGHR
jgi:hypothetical protein